MSFAVLVDSAPCALQRRLPLGLAVFALAASLLACAAAEPSQRGWIALASFACFAIALGRRRRARARRSRAEGSLRIDEAGCASWIDANDRARVPHPVRIERWNVLGPFAWLRLRFDDGSGVLDVMLAQRPAPAGEADRAGEDDWRRLRAWLLWYGRGAASARGMAAVRARQ